MQKDSEQLTKFVREYNLAANNQIKETRAIMADATASLQKQISMHGDALSNIKPRLAKCEGDIMAANKRADKQGVNIEKCFNDIHKLNVEKVPHVEDKENRKQLDK